MTYNVFYHDINKKCIVPFNVFDHTGFTRDVLTHLKKSESKEEFASHLRSTLMYYFWCKAEYEITLSPWCGAGEPVKIDIYTQVVNNWEIFLNYVWNFREER